MVFLGVLVMFSLAIFRRKVYDEYNDEMVELSKEETKMIKKMLKGKAPHSDFNPFPVCSFILCP